jgi:hypothetical protein
VKCPKGSFNDATRQSQCKDCPAGFQCPVTGMNKQPKDYAGDKFKCPAGAFSVGAAVTCSPCPVNTYAASLGSSACAKCSTGQNTRGKTGSSKCTAARGLRRMA